MKRFNGAVAIAILLLLAPPAALHARGEAAMDLSYADKLISEKRYEEAQNFLVETMKKHPDHWEEGQSRLLRIDRIMAQYNKVLEQLIAEYRRDKPDEARKLALQKELNRLNPNPSAEQKRVLEQLYETTAFLAYSGEMEAIFTRAGTLLAGGDYLGAARQYQGIFVLYKDEFDAAPPGGPLIKERVDAGLAGIAQAIDAYAVLRPLLDAAKASLSTELAASGERGLAALSSGTAPLQSLVERRNAMATQGSAFKTQAELLKLPDRSFLPFAFRAVLGRTDFERPNGILGAMDRDFASIMSILEDTAGQGAQATYRSMESAYAAGNWSAVSRAAPDARARALAAAGLLGLWEPIEKKDAELGIDEFGSAALAGKRATALAYRHQEALAALLARSSDLMANLASLEADFNKAQASAKGGQPQAGTAAISPAQAATAILALYRATEAERLSADGISADLAALRRLYQDSEPPLPSGWKDSQARAESRAQAQTARAQSLQVEEAAAAAALEYRALAEGIEQGRSFLSQARSYLAGIASYDPELKDFLLKYPDRSASLAARGEDAGRAAYEAIRVLAAKYRAFPAFVVSSASMQAWLREEAAGEQTALELITSCADLGRQAKAQSLQAETAKQDAERRMAEARSALAQNNFDLANTRVERAKVLFGQSLGLQWDPDLKASSDARAESLLTEILKARQQRVVVDKRKLLSQGTDYFYSGDFERATEYFSQAQVLHRSAFDGDDPEAAFWLGLAQSAASTRSGATIPQTAALYPEMSQLLSKARLLYEQGKNLLSRNKGNLDGLRRLEEATALVNQVQVAFPRNQDAAILLLQIELLKGEGEDRFKKSFDEANRKVASPSAATAWEGYNELLNLQAIDPSWKGMADAIYKAKVKLKLVAAPAAPKDLTRARELIAQARAIIEKNNRPLFQDALDMLNQALAIDPSNAEAISLKDRLERDLPQSTVRTESLSSVDASRYAEAETLYANQQYLRSYEIISALWETPKNRNIAKVRTLREKLMKALGIRE